MSYAMRPADRVASKVIGGVNDPARAARILRREGALYRQASDVDTAEALYQHAEQLEASLHPELVRKRPAND
jgi:hypothetical protein